GVEVRSLEVGDIDACEALCKQVHGWERTGELRDAMQAFAPFVVVRDGQVVGYLTTATLWPMAHGVAVSEEDMEALLLGVAAQAEEPLAFLGRMQRALAVVGFGRKASTAARWRSRLSTTSSSSSRSGAASSTSVTEST